MIRFLIDVTEFAIVYVIGFWSGWRTHRKGIEAQARAFYHSPRGQHWIGRMIDYEVRPYDQDEEEG